jgi:S-adenosylmethionine/arginine decarboxylase-like enzyme
MCLIRKPLTTEKEIKDWLSRLVHAVGMEVWWGPVSKNCTDPGNEGPSGIVLLKTSHASIHFWTKKEVPYCQMDLYSCKRFDPKVVLKLLAELDPIEIRHKMIYRNAGIPQR